MASLSGIKSIVVSGTQDWVDKVNKVDYSHVKNVGKTVILTIEENGFNMSWSPIRASVVITMNDDTTLFVGTINQTEISETKRVTGDKVWKITCVDIEASYVNIPVNISFKDTTITNIFNSLINGYTDDYLGTVGDYSEKVSIVFSGTNLSSALHELASIIYDGAVWRITAHADGTPVHNLIDTSTSVITSFNNNNEILVEELRALELNFDNFYNIIDVAIPNCVMTKKSKRMALFNEEGTEGRYLLCPGDIPGEKSDDELGCLAIPLSGNPQNIELFVMVAESGGIQSASDYFKCNLMRIAVDGATEEDRQHTMPDPMRVFNDNDTTSQIAQQALGSLNTIRSHDLQRAVTLPESDVSVVCTSVNNSYNASKRGITCLYKAPPDPTATNMDGYLWVYPLDKLMHYYDEFAEANGFAKPPRERVVGYLVTYNKKQEIRFFLRDDDSIATYGERLLSPPLVLADCPDLRWAHLKADAMMASKCDPVKAGIIPYISYWNGIPHYPDYPEVGDIVGIDGPYDTETGLVVSEVKHVFEGTACRSQVAINGSTKRIQANAYLKRIEQMIARLNQSNDPTGFALTKEFTDSIEFVEDSDPPSTESFDWTDMEFGKEGTALIWL